MATPHCQMSTPAKLWFYPTCLSAGNPPVHFVSSYKYTSCSFDKPLDLRRVYPLSHTHTHTRTHTLTLTHTQHISGMDNCTCINVHTDLPGTNETWKPAARTIHSMFSWKPGRFFCLNLYSNRRAKHILVSSRVRLFWLQKTMADCEEVYKTMTLLLTWCISLLVASLFLKQHVVLVCWKLGLHSK